MKDFLKYTLATIVGVIACVIIVSIISIVAVVGIVASSTAPTTTIKENSLFKLELKGTVAERLIDNPLASIMSEEQNALGLNDILASIQKAADNDYIKGIYLEAGKTYRVEVTPTDLRDTATSTSEYLGGFKLMDMRFIYQGETNE